MVTIFLPANRNYPTTNDERPTTALLLLPNRNVICIGDRDKVQQSSDDHKLRAVIRGCEGDRALTPIHCQRDNVEPARTDISNKSKNVENVPAIRLVNSPLHRESEQEKRNDRDEEQESAYPAFLDHVSRARDQPSHGRRKHGHRAD